MKEDNHFRGEKLKAPSIAYVILVSDDSRNLLKIETNKSLVDSL